ncbi:CHASE2 domain-containing protein [Thermomonas sp.]|uniref:CHASE2 domain-containing protein n=1 Tax=Thermomonas sp. TaxID=1971895 RepID=UPI002487B642|nr:CHASE2 domain-containing protein [Thermomonas sp.]MDI1252093.1 CHASE2 domain-containing protein [Thermomonas sp.]
MLGKLAEFLITLIEAVMSTLAVVFMDAWTVVERGYRRPLSQLMVRAKFVVYPLIAIAAVGWLSWDWTHDRSLNTAEDAIFDTVIQWRPVEPKPSGRTVVVEIDDCSIEYFRDHDGGGWPWSRQRHADLLDALDRAGVRAVGYDVLFMDTGQKDPDGDAVLDAMADAGNGRFLFGASRVHSDFDNQEGATAVSDAPGAFALTPNPVRPGPRVALLLPTGAAMARHSALLDVDRSADGVFRDIHLRKTFGDWALPSLPLRLAAFAIGRPASSFPESVRVNWRENTRLPSVSAADLIEGKRICHDATDPMPDLKGSVVLVGYNAAGLNDAKPTPVDPMMPGVEVHAEAVEALLNDSAIWMPPTSVKYLLAGFMVLLTAFAFWRGEPHEDVDGIFVAVNVVLLLSAVIGLSFFGVFIDIFASVGFISLCFGLCRMYAAVQRGRAIGNNDFRDEYDAGKYPWLVMARLRYVPDTGLAGHAATKRRREYRRRLRRFLYSGTDAVMIEGIVERKSWLHDILDDLMMLVWTGTDEADAYANAKRELDLLYQRLNEHTLRIDDQGIVRVAIVAAMIDDNVDDNNRGEQMRLRELLGHDLNTNDEWPLSASNTYLKSMHPPHIET